MPRPIILDCDPGHDDAISLILALSSDALDVLAVTTSAGNQTPDKTLNNALRVLTLLGRHDIPVAGGAPKPLARELIIADNVHGESGLDGPKLPDPAFTPVTQSAIELMAEKVRAVNRLVVLVLLTQNAGDENPLGPFAPCLAQGPRGFSSPAF